jgi:hypothetical protein
MHINYLQLDEEVELQHTMSHTILFLLPPLYRSTNVIRALAAQR